MVKVSDVFTLAAAVVVTTVGTALKVEKAESWTVSTTVSTNTGGYTVLLEGSIDGTNYQTINTTTKAAANTDGFDVSKALTPYMYIRPTVTMATTGSGDATVTVTCRTQGADS